MGGRWLRGRPLTDFGRRPNLHSTTGEGEEPWPWRTEFDFELGCFTEAATLTPALSLGGPMGRKSVP